MISKDLLYTRPMHSMDNANPPSWAPKPRVVAMIHCGFQPEVKLSMKSKRCLTWEVRKKYGKYKNSGKPLLGRAHCKQNRKTTSTEHIKQKFGRWFSSSKGLIFSFHLSFQESYLLALASFKNLSFPEVQMFDDSQPWKHKSSFNTKIRCFHPKSR